MNHETRTHLDLFSGVGGFSLAAQWAGFRTVGFCEIDPYAQQILIKNFGAVLADARCKRGTGRRESSNLARQTGKVKGKTSERERMRNPISNGGQIIPRIHSDIRILNGADYFGVDLITGGFPCQPYSLAGKRRGAADDRALWPEMRRVIAEARPRWVLAENVPGIINLELDTALSDLEGIGYATGTIVIPACAVDAPHRRDRVWIVAHGAGTGQKHDCQVQAGGKQPRRNAACRGRGNVANRILPRLEKQQCQPRDNEAKFTAPQRNGHERRQWEPEPELGRVAHGIPNRVDRLKCLGNAIVWQVAAEIIKAMIQSEESEPHGD